MEEDFRPVFEVGDPVRKVGGDYTLTGIVVAVFQKQSGAWRFVVEASEPRGLLMIYKEENLELCGGV